MKMSAPQRFSYFVLLGSLITLAGCSTGTTGTPSSGQAEAAVQKMINDRSEGRITLGEFRKTDGQSGEAFGAEWYELEFEGGVEFLEDCYWSPRSTWGAQFSTVTGRPRNDLQAINPEYSSRRPARRGDRIPVSGSVGFEKKESGWVASRIEVEAANAR